MKKIKVFSLIALSAVLFAGIFSSSFLAKAEESTVTAPTLGLTDYEVLPGEDFETTLYIAENSEICNFQISLAFDPNLVSVVSAEENDNCGGDLVVNVTENQFTLTSCVCRADQAVGISCVDELFDHLVLVAGG